MPVLPAFFWIACGTSEPPRMHVAPQEGSLAVSANVPLSSVRLVDKNGVPQSRAQPPVPTAVLTLVVPPGTVGELRVEAQFSGGTLVEPIIVEARSEHLWVEVQAPIGAPATAVSEGTVVPVSVVEGSPVPIVVRVKVPFAGTLDFLVDGTSQGSADAARGERVAHALSVSDDAVIAVKLGEERVAFRIDTTPTPIAQLQTELTITELGFPANANGSIDLIRPAGRITVPSEWWRAILARLGLGARVHDPFEPWAWAGVSVRNQGDTPADLIIRTRVVDPDGQPDPSFRPRVREGDDGTGNTSVMVRIPARSTVVATLPVYVDEARLGEGPWTQHVELFPVGLDRSVATFDAPLYASRGSSVVSAGLALALVGSASGIGYVVFRLRRWLSSFDTRILVTIALFASLSFVVGTAAQLVGLGIASATGPFATMIIGFFDDAFAVTITCTLLAFAPRPGVVALCTLVSWLLRGMALGSLSPLDIVFVGCRIAFYEGSLWLFGLTRSGAWRDLPAFSRRLRLAAGFGVASLCTATASMVFHAVLYRLFFAEWYVAMILAGPGFSYAIVGTLIGDRMAAALRRVED